MQAAPAMPGAQVRYGGFWIRVVAYLIDSAIVGGATFGLLFATKPITTACPVDANGNLDLTSPQCVTTISPAFYAFLAIPFVYLLVLWAIGGTIGQRILGMKVVNATTGANLGLAKSFLRVIGYIISAAVIYIGLIWVAFDPRKQGWHDKIAGSVVVRG